LGPNFGSVSYQTTIGNSNYNALEASVHHTSGRVQLFVSYTYSKSIDMLRISAIRWTLSIRTSSEDSPPST
jgi:hypothetical protein